jgi:hypothetical protein
VLNKEKHWFHFEINNVKVNILFVEFGEEGPPTTPILRQPSLASE